MVSAVRDGDAAALHLWRNQESAPACSHLAGRGVAAVVIKKLAGHSSIAMTNRYMHKSEGDL